MVVSFSTLESASAIMLVTFPMVAPTAAVMVDVAFSLNLTTDVACSSPSAMMSLSRALVVHDVALLRHLLVSAAGFPDMWSCMYHAIAHMISIETVNFPVIEQLPLVVLVSD